MLKQKKISEKDIYEPIAHEFAHHVLKHESPMKNGMADQNEADVQGKLKEWGFTE